jgi:hypothetical protein
MRSKTVVPTLEFAARLNREVGLGSEDRTPGVTIIFKTNLRPGSLRRRSASDPPTPKRG